MDAITIKTMIEGFTDTHFWAEFGPAHIVLSDFNLSDAFLVKAIADLENEVARLSANGYSKTELDSDPAKFIEVYQTPNDVIVHIETLEFIKRLQDTPEDERNQVAWRDVDVRW